MNEMKKATERETLKEYLYANPEGTLFITHNDADGLACIVADVVFRSERNRSFGLISHIDKTKMKEIYKIVDVNRVEDTIYEYARIHRNLPKTIIITDLSFQKGYDDDLLAAINSLNKKGDLTIELYDHHKTATWLNDYEWAHITGNPEYSAASYYALCKYKSIGVDLENDTRRVTREQLALWGFLQKIARYDTWKWKESPDYITDEYPTLLIPILGYWNWVFYVINAIFTGGNEDLDFFIKKICENQVYSRLKRATASLENVKEIHEWCTDILPIDQVKTYLILGNHKINILHEVVANHIPNDIPYLFCVLCPDTKKLSMRTMSDDVDCSEIAQRLAVNGKGGGHVKAAGCTISDELALILITKYYQSNTSILDIAD